MSYSLDAREVLRYLNELGYKNVTALQLKEFMRDLKKLMKYEERRSQMQTNIENIRPRSPILPNPPNTISDLCATSTEVKPNLNSRHKVIAVEIKGPNGPSCVNYLESPHDEIRCRIPTEISSSCAQNCETRTEDKHNNSQVEMALNIPSTNELTMTSSCKKLKTESLERQRSAKNKAFSLKPKASFIRPAIPLKVSRSDPVALYHRYQEGWKKQKLPGEDSRANLRWTIREKMLGQPVYSAAHSMERITHRNKVTNRI